MLTTGGSRLARVDVADNDDVDVSLLLTVVVVSMLCMEIIAGRSCMLNTWRLGGAYPMVAVVSCKLKVEGKV